jgi:hypothetical protein
MLPHYAFGVKGVAGGRYGNFALLMIMLYNCSIMTEIEELIKEASAAFKAWKKPSLERPERHPIKSWQEVMDSRVAPAISRR